MGDDLFTKIISETVTDLLGILTELRKYRSDNDFSFLFKFDDEEFAKIFSIIISEKCYFV